jgi:outer membrane receptor protein involved in Fe transport
MNYAYTEIDGRNPDGSKAILPGVSKNNVNLIGYYETPKYGVRLVYNYRDKYGLAAGSTYVGAARTVKARGQLDASASYHINDYITVSVDGFNLTDATRAEYENSPMKPRRIDYDGRTFEASLQATF